MGAVGPPGTVGRVAPVAVGRTTGEIQRPVIAYPLGFGFAVGERYGFHGGLAGRGLGRGGYRLGRRQRLRRRALHHQQQREAP